MHLNGYQYEVSVPVPSVSTLLILVKYMLIPRHRYWFNFYVDEVLEWNMFLKNILTNVCCGIFGHVLGISNESQNPNATLTQSAIGASLADLFSRSKIFQITWRVSPKRRVSPLKMSLLKKSLSNTCWWLQKQTEPPSPKSRTRVTL